MPTTKKEFSTIEATLLDFGLSPVVKNPEVETTPLGFGLFPVVENSKVETTQTGENYSSERRSFINRKVDRFTYTTRYLYQGKTKAGKTWSKWRTLQALSVTVKNGKVNIFLVGNAGRKAKFLQVVNISRQTYLVNQITGQLDNPTKVLFMKEVKSLLTRTEHVLADSFNVTDVPAQALRAIIYPTWDYVQVYNPDLDRHIFPPAFATQAMRSNSFAEALTFLTSHKELQLIKFLTKNPTCLKNDKVLLFLMLSRKKVSEDFRLKTISSLMKPVIQVRSSEPEFGLKAQLSYILSINSFSAADLASVKGLLNCMTVEQRERVLQSEPFGSLSSVANIWNVNKYAIKNFNKTYSFKSNNFNNWAEVFVLLQAEIDNISYGNDDKNEVVPELDLVLQNLALLPNLVVKRTHTNKKRLSPKLPKVYNSVLVNCIPLLDFDKNNMRTLVKTSIVIPDDKNTLMRKILKELNIHYGKNFDPPLRALYSFDTWHFTDAEYLSFLKAIQVKAKQDLETNNVPVTQENLGAYLAMFMIVHSNSLPFLKFKGQIPRKWFTLMRRDASFLQALVFVDKRVSLKVAEGFIGMPDSWTLKVFGLEDSLQPGYNLFDF